MQTFENKSWFHSMDLDPFGRVVVYAKHIDRDVLSSVPDTLNGKQVLVHFANFKTATREKFTDTITAFTIGDEPDKDIFVSEDDADHNYLITELDHLERQCGADILFDIFYETHDKENAITEWSKRYPDIKVKMDQLYDQYGFDVIYSELEG